MKFIKLFLCCVLDRKSKKETYGKRSESGNKKERLRVSDENNSCCISAFTVRWIILGNGTYNYRRSKFCVHYSRRHQSWSSELRKLQIVKKDTVTLGSLWGFCCVSGVMLHFWHMAPFLKPFLFLWNFFTLFSNLESYTWISIDWKFYVFEWKCVCSVLHLALSGMLVFWLKTENGGQVFRERWCFGVEGFVTWASRCARSNQTLLLMAAMVTSSANKRVCFNNSYWPVQAKLIWWKIENNC